MKRSVAVLLSAAFLIVLFAVPASARQVIKANQHDTFAPTPVHVSKGERVVWRNTDLDDHVVKSTSSNWNKDTLLMPGETTARRFRHAGKFTYRCTIHANMKGVINVG